MSWNMRNLLGRVRGLWRAGGASGTGPDQVLNLDPTTQADGLPGRQASGDVRLSALRDRVQLPALGLDGSRVLPRLVEQGRRGVAYLEHEGVVGEERDGLVVSVLYPRQVDVEEARREDADEERLGFCFLGDVRVRWPVYGGRARGSRGRPAQCPPETSLVPGASTRSHVTLASAVWS